MPVPTGKQNSVFYITVNGRLRYYHPEHFSCASCERRIGATEEFMAADGRVQCYACYVLNNAPRCAGCLKSIVGQYREVVGLGCYHDGCFNCSKCSRALGNEAFYLEQNKPTCLKCLKWVPPPRT